MKHTVDVVITVEVEASDPRAAQALTDSTVTIEPDDRITLKKYQIGTREAFAINDSMEKFAGDMLTEIRKLNRPAGDDWKPDATGGE